MKVLLYGINFSPELTGIGKYSGEMADWFAGRGHEVRIVTAPPYYPDWKVHAGFRNHYKTEVRDGLIIYRCPLYVPSQPTSIKRLLHLVTFALASLVVLLRLLFWRPQVVFMVEPTFTCAPAALVYARLTGAKAILHIQDFEVDAMFGLGMMGRARRLVGVVRACESWIMRRFDLISTISRSMMSNAVRKGISASNVILFPNWVDTDFISPASSRKVFRDRWSIPEASQVVLYSGNMGRKQGLEMVIDAAARFRERKDVVFLMVGEGAARAEIEAQALAAGLQNVIFKPLQAYEDLPCLLATADVHLVVQRRGAADVVLPSKLTGILSAGGNALITAEAETELGLLVADTPGIADLVEPESLDAFCDCLQKMLMRDLAVTNQVARNYALQFLNRDAVLARFEARLLALCQA